MTLCCLGVFGACASAAIWQGPFRSSRQLRETTETAWTMAATERHRDRQVRPHRPGPGRRWGSNQPAHLCWQHGTALISASPVQMPAETSSIVCCGKGEREDPARCFASEEGQEGAYALNTAAETPKMAA